MCRPKRLINSQSMQINNISRVGTKRSHWCVFFNIWAENPELNDNGFRWSSKVKIMSYQQNNKLKLYAHNLKHKSKKKIGIWKKLPSSSKLLWLTPTVVSMLESQLCRKITSLKALLKGIASEPVCNWWKYKKKSWEDILKNNDFILTEIY